MITQSKQTHPEITTIHENALKDFILPQNKNPEFKEQESLSKTYTTKGIMKGEIHIKQIKIFTFQNTDDLEKAVNNFLKSHTKIRSIQYAISPYYLHSGELSYQYSAMIVYDVDISHQFGNTHISTPVTIPYNPNIASPTRQSISYSTNTYSDTERLIV